MKKYIVLLLTILIVSSLCACSDVANDPPALIETPDAISPTPTATAKVNTPAPTPRPSATTAPSPTPTPYNGPVNPLTGLPVDEDSSNLRPLAIMINNIRDALPQHSVSKADIIYETLAEGGITRMLAVFQDITGAGRIGSVRSARAYYIDLAMGHDAIYVHAGGSPQSYDIIYSRGISTIDGVAGYSELFYRDEYRMYNAGYEHSLFTTDELLNEHLPGYDWVRREHNDGFECNMQFADEAAPKNGELAGTVEVFFSDYKTGVFEYDSETGLYMVSQYGSAYVDGNTDEQVGVTNVLVLYTYISSIYGDSAGRIDVDLDGNGSGIFICGGRAIPIEWSKDGYNSQFEYTLEDGQELVFGRGTTYINIIPVSNSVTISE